MLIGDMTIFFNYYFILLRFLATKIDANWWHDHAFFYFFSSSFKV